MTNKIQFEGEFEGRKISIAPAGRGDMVIQIPELNYMDTVKRGWFFFYRLRRARKAATKFISDLEITMTEQTEIKPVSGSSPNNERFKQIEKGLSEHKTGIDNLANTLETLKTNNDTQFDDLGIALREILKRLEIDFTENADNGESTEEIETETQTEAATESENNEK